jgi:hypothetical protein
MSSESYRNLRFIWRATYPRGYCCHQSHGARETLATGELKVESREPNEHDLGTATIDASVAHRVCSSSWSTFAHLPSFLQR